MDTMRMITMSMREINRLKMIQAVAEGNLKVVSAACQHGSCRRQVDRLANQYRVAAPAHPGPSACPRDSRPASYTPGTCTSVHPQPRDRNDQES